METLKLDKPTALRLYPTAAPEFRTMLESTFGKSAFSGKITDRLTCLADCYAYLGIDPCNYKRPTPIDDQQAAANAVLDAYIAVEAINERWVPNYDNSSESKYEIWWDMRSSRFGYDYYGNCYSGSDAGSRLCFKSRELAQWAAKQSWFVDICKKFMTR